MLRKSICDIELEARLNATPSDGWTYDPLGNATYYKSGLGFILVYNNVVIPLARIIFTPDNGKPSTFVSTPFDPNFATHEAVIEYINEHIHELEQMLEKEEEE